MYPCNKPPRRHNDESGIAIVIVLSMVALISVMLMAFLNRMNTDRSASYSYSQSLKADQIARGSLQLIITDLQQEMGKDGAPDTTYPEKPLYTNVTGSNIAPQATGTCAGAPTLIKISGTAPSYTGSIASGTLLLSSTICSTTPSSNGRYVDLSRWNLPQLGALTAAEAPYWVIVTRSGVSNGVSTTLGPGANTLNNSALSNSNYAVGRFAYTIYDEGGLLDITTAGYPAHLLSTPSAVQPIKGTLAGADVSVLGIDANALTQWRNAASASSGTNYIAYVSGSASASGFKKVNAGDRTFLSRQDLIKAAQNNIAGLTTSMLPNLTTFTRERNAPSWRPAYDAADRSGSNGANNAYAYKSNALTTSSTNPFIPCVRYSGTTISGSATIKSYAVDGFTRADYSVVPGDPVVFRRFPLDRLNWIGPSGPQNGATDDAIQTCFGLHWDSGSAVWQYVGPSGTTVQGSIKTLAQVRDEPTPREPNFFELLQAGILAGALAKDGDSPATSPSNATFDTTAQRKSEFHVFRIGANIISQYDPTSCPIVIAYNPAGSPPYWQACGIESLPYLNFFKALAGTTATTGPNTLNNYFVFSLWNPHQGNVPVARPSVRLGIEGSFGVINNYTTLTTKYSGYPGYGDSIAATYVELTTSGSNGVNAFSEPGVPVQADINSPLGAGNSNGHAWTLMPAISTADTNNYLGYRIPDFSVNPAITGSVGDQRFQWVRMGVGNDANDPFNAWLEFKNPGGKWIPYNHLLGINDPAAGRLAWFPGWYVVGTGTGTTPQLPPLNLAGYPSGLSWMVGTSTVAWQVCDPRSIRFNPTMAQGISRSYWKGSIWSATTEPSLQAKGLCATQLIPNSFYKSNYYMAQLSRNNQSSGGSNTYSYPDRDGITRIADSGLFTATPSTNGWAGDPYARSSDRPVVLDRSFYSVGELGFVSRDYPWRTLDFFTAASADSGLLDLFTVMQCTDKVVAGRINLNTPNEAVLQSVLTETMADVVGVTPLSKPDQVATDLAAATSSSAGKLVGRDELATKFAPSLGVNDFSSTDEQYIKTRREGVVRALADVGQTRTWNLLIDIIAQSGRYPINASRLDQFSVEGERHYWLHVAIDRFTCEVIDQQLELISQ